MSDNPLIMPIDVAALAVGQGDVDEQARVLAAMADFSCLPSAKEQGPYISASVLSNAVPFEGLVPAVTGVHLHWALPSILNQGQATDAGLMFPAVPDRWLVTRCVVTPGGAPRLRSWVVESDRLSNQATVTPGLVQPTLPRPPVRGGASHAFLGQSFAAQGWRELGNSVERAPRPFTALGYGTPTFAAFYPNCCSVFGFHDPLDDVPAQEDEHISLTYQVIGWYAEPGEDPLRDAEAAARFGWHEQQGPHPDRLLCSGVVDGLPWVSGRRYLDDQAQEITAAIAASPQEALSALMADNQQPGQANQADTTEQLLNALQFDLLSGAQASSDALLRFEEAVHDAGFVTLSGGLSWRVERRSGADAGTAANLPQALARPLDELNRLQARADDLERHCQAYQAQLFLHWYQYQMMSYASDTVPKNLQQQSGKMLGYLLERCDEIDARRTGLAGVRQQIDEQEQQLRGQLPPLLDLALRTGAPRFYQPSEPVLVLHGADVQPMQRYDTSDDSYSRLASELIDRLELPAGALPGSPAIRLDSTLLPRLPIDSGLPLGEVFQALWRDALHVSPGLQPLLLETLASQALPGNPARQDPAACLALLRTGCTALASVAPTLPAYHGRAPSPRYCQVWERTPWLPFLLQFKVDFSPVHYLPPDASDGYAADFIQRHFSFDEDNLDLHYQGPAPQWSQTFSATALLTPNATLDLEEAIDRYLEGQDSADPQLLALRERIGQLPLLAQGITGFNEALLMQQATLQLPVADPLASLSVAKLAEPVAPAVDGQNRCAPLPQNSFNPLRSGLLRIDSLRLVDAFGRFKNYPAPRTVVAQGLLPGPALAGHGGAFLAPRITQAARLQFRWLAAARPDASSSQDSPLLGWVIPNHLDNALMFYGDDGKPLGELALSGQRVLWTAAPLGGFALGSSLLEVFATQPDDFARFAEGLYHQGNADFLGPFMGALNDALSFSLPARFAETAQQVVLSGQPLVLTRASLALELAGPAASSQSWQSLGRSLLAQAPADQAQLCGVDFPVKLGALTKLEDTLVSYWLDPRQAEDYRHCYVPCAERDQGGVTAPRQDTLTLTANGTAREVVMLLDPRGSVHASTGILPVKRIDIEARHYAGTLAALDLTFETFPLLCGARLYSAEGEPTAMGMVLPRVASGDWHWIQASAEGWRSQPLVDSANLGTGLDHTPQRITEGWLGIRRPNLSPDID